MLWSCCGILKESKITRKVPGVVFKDILSIVVGILKKEREPWIGKLSWHGNFDTRCERAFCLIL